jgi:hypothetical protein
MSSSTSSSSPSAAAPRRPYVKALIAIVLGMGASMAVVQGFTYLNNASAETILDRVMEARSYLPAIVEEEKDLVMVFGSSMTDAGFAARQFDSELAERGVDVKSFNFGFGGINPYFQDYLSRRIRDEFSAGDRRLKLALIEFTPLQNTKARWQGARPIVDSYEAMLANGEEIWEIVKKDPTRGIRVAEIKYLRNEISAEMITWFFGDQWFGTSGRPDAGVPPDEAKDKVLELVLELAGRRHHSRGAFAGDTGHVRRILESRAQRAATGRRSTVARHMLRCRGAELRGRAGRRFHSHREQLQGVRRSSRSDSLAPQPRLDRPSAGGRAAVTRGAGAHSPGDRRVRAQFRGRRADHPRHVQRHDTSGALLRGRGLHQLAGGDIRSASSAPPLMG